MTEKPQNTIAQDKKYSNSEIVSLLKRGGGGGSNTSLSSTSLVTNSTDTPSFTSFNGKSEAENSRRLKPPLPPQSLARSRTLKSGSSTASSSCNLRELIDRLHDKSPSKTPNVRPSMPLLMGRLQTPPRRIFPQTYSGTSQERRMSDVFEEARRLEPSPVVFDANLSFVLGCGRQSVHQTLRASPSYQEQRTASANLSEKIRKFLQRTDHVQEEWTAFGQRLHARRTASPCGTSDYSGTSCSSLTVDRIERQRQSGNEQRDMLRPLGRSRSSQNILTKAFQLTKQIPPTPLRRSSSARNSRQRSMEANEENRENSGNRGNANRNGIENDCDNDCTIQEQTDGEGDFDELSEMAVDLSEERSTANMATERLEAETAERLRLEKELSDQHTKVQRLQESSEKLEMELLCAKSDMNCISEDEDVENDGSSAYKIKYERVSRELEFTKRRLQTQHEHDLEQLIGLKKQLEKKLTDAYEEVEEQRQIVGQWKRKSQKMTNEMNDLRMLLEEQNARNNLLEKKQRKFDVECQGLQDVTRQERQAKERLTRENDILLSEKFTLEQSLADTKLELDLKEEKLAALQRELEEMTFSGGTEEEIAQLRRSKNELDRRVKEQEEELDEMAGQVQLLEQAKLRLEMALETMRKEARREAQQRDEELEEVRGNSYKKIKGLECQLENEHEERTLLLREKHELERRLANMEDQDRADRHTEEATNQKLRRDLRKYKALLKDAQAQIERLKTSTSGKNLIRQLRNQLEDAQSARFLATKARQSLESELAETQALLEESNRARIEAEEKATSVQRDCTELQSQVEENEEEMTELMRKYSAVVKQLNTEQMAISETAFKISELETERNNLKEQVVELQNRLENIEQLADPSAALLTKRLEMRTRELESRLELEQMTKGRLEVQVSRYKESLEKIQNELSHSKMRELQAQDALKKSMKSLRELREELHIVAGREQECTIKRKDLEKRHEQLDLEATSLRNDLRLALQRAADLQRALEEGDDDEDELTESEESHSSDVSLSDLEEQFRQKSSPTTVLSRASSIPKQNGSASGTNGGYISSNPRPPTLVIDAGNIQGTA